MKTENTKIAVLSGQTVRKFVNRLKKAGLSIDIDRPNHKRVTDEDGNCVFSALKYSSGWDCRVNIDYFGTLQELL